MLYELFVLPLDRRLLKGREFVSQFTVAPLVPRTVSGNSLLQGIFLAQGSLKHVIMYDYYNKRWH